MTRLAACLCLAALLLIAVLAGDCLATQGTVNGVLSQEMVVKLPQDAGKWYISVVGAPGDARYAKVLDWFSTSDNLNRLKDQVHYRQIDSNTAIYRERYAQNVQGLPTVRVQDSLGVVIYEAAGSSLPMTADGLYAAIAGAAMKAQGLFPILPWRREMERRCPGPCPTPNPEPDTAPDMEVPPVDDGGAPEFEETADQGVGWLIAGTVLCAVAGAAVGGIVQWKKTYPK